MKTNLKAVRKATGLTQKDVSARTGIALGTLRNWEQEVYEPDMDSIIQLAGLYGVTTDTLLGSDYADDLSTVVRIPNEGFTDVPLYGRIAAGEPIEMDAVEDYYPVPTPIVNKHKDVFLLRVEGESMNKVLPNGCLALIEKCSDCDMSGKPYAVCVNGYDATIKRVKKLNNGFELVPDSTDPTFETQVFNYNEPGTEEITIIGRVVYHMLPFDWEY